MYNSQLIIATYAEMGKPSWMTNLELKADLVTNDPSILFYSCIGIGSMASTLGLSRLSFNRINRCSLGLNLPKSGGSCRANATRTHVDCSTVLIVKH
jgi:hypothetical protein